MTKKLNTYRIDGMDLDSIDVKCMLNSSGVFVSDDVYEQFGAHYRVTRNPFVYQSLYFSDGITANMRDASMRMTCHTQSHTTTAGEQSLINHMDSTPFLVDVEDGVAVLKYKGEVIDQITFPYYTGFYEQKCPSGLRFIDAATLQADRWNSWAYLWPCAFAVAGDPCKYCMAGIMSSEFVADGGTAKSVSVEDFVEMTRFSMDNGYVSSLQITGGSSMDGNLEARYIIPYLDGLAEGGLLERLSEDILLYVTPPTDFGIIDEYLAHGAKRIACSVEVWDEDLARIITPGKIKYTTRQRHLDVWDYGVEKFGPNVMFTNFVTGIESFETLEAGVRYAADHGVYPGVCIWGPTGSCCDTRGVPILPPGVDYYRRAKELYYEIYRDYGFVPDRTAMPNDLQAEIYNYLIADDEVERGRAPLPSELKASAHPNGIPGKDA